jgi:hypothetical protein
VKVRKRIVRRRRSKKKQYFGKEQHEAIVKYQSTESQEEKRDIYVVEIMPAFNKLAENLIFIHGFSKSTGIGYEVLKSDCVSFLYETLPKFDATRGTKAFSYFNVVAKNWLIIKSKKVAKNRSRCVSFDDPDAIHAIDPNFFERYVSNRDLGYEMIKKESIDNLFGLMNEIKEKVSSDNESACINAIITLFSQIDELDLLNKRAVFVYMREISGLNPKQLSVAMSSIRKHYKVLVKDDRFDIFF